MPRRNFERDHGRIAFHGRGNFRGVFATHVAADIHGRGKVRPTNIVTSWMLARQRRKIEPSAFISASVYGRAGVRVLPEYSNIIRGLHAAKVFLVLSLCSCWAPTRNTTGGKSLRSADVESLVLGFFSPVHPCETFPSTSVPTPFPRETLCLRRPLIVCHDSFPSSVNVRATSRNKARHVPRLEDP